MWSLLLLVACKNPLKDTSVPANCEPRLAFYPDADGDGAGNETAPYVGCEAPDGYVSAAGDCNDQDAAVQTDCDTAADTAGDTSSDSGV